ncbi:hypothetical protein DFH94DRAFT_650457 [Russula ochroleuca]|uniref:DUF7137 domain-containing protein n=1 Tax=Russula ochroleuca TaxID=152965 RepID=A0A9P5MW80_9AGAM|nr:hypothetical protein DFH94DRAFT_650457 [Russula ochroleuca]
MSSTAASSSSRSANSTSTSIPASVPAGLITITQPPQTTIAFFKVAPSQPITFAWNFSYVLSTPASLTVSAICDNGNTYPVGPTNGVIPGTATSVIWDAYGWQEKNPNSPLAQATYTLEIFDERGPGSARSPGLLQPNNALKFALYTPQGYTPISSGWQCTGCNSGALPTAHPAFFCICLTIFVMFASGFAMLRNAAR